MRNNSNSLQQTKRLISYGVFLFGSLLALRAQPLNLVAAAEQPATTAASGKTNPAPATTPADDAQTPTADPTPAPTDSSTQPQPAPAAPAQTTAATDATPTTPAAQPDAATDWIAKDPADKKFALTATVSRNGQDYQFRIQKPNSDAPMFSNSVTTAGGPETTYSFDQGSSRSSKYYLRDDKNQVTDLVEFSGPDSYEAWKSADPKQPALKQSFKSMQGVSLNEVLTIDPTGRFVHTVTVTNDGTTPITNTHFGTELDTMLGPEDDHVPILADGAGNAYIQSADKTLTLFLDGLKNADVYTGKFRMSGDLQSRVKATGNYGDVLLSGQDSAVQYETPAITLAPGQSYTYSYAEALYTTPVTFGAVTIHYVDQAGKSLKPATKIGDVVGTAYTTTPATIAGYHLIKTLGQPTGTYTDAAQSVTYVYASDPATPSQPTGQPTTVNPTPKTPTKPTAKPAQSATPTAKPQSTVTKLTNLATPAATPVVSAKTTLPQTGDSSDQQTVTLGAAVLALFSLGGLAFTGRRRDNR